MASAVLIQPDTAFIRDVIASGGGDLKKCFQCATCSVVCEMSSDEAPFPRKQMIEAQWGLKKQLVGDPALWLCHNCGTCTTQCPRGARPGDVLGALRNKAIQQFAFPGFLGRLVASPKAWPLLYLLPMLIFMAIAWWAPKAPSTPRLEFANVFPIPVLEPLFFAVAGFVLVAFGIGLRRCVRAIRVHGARGKIPTRLLPAIWEILTNERLKACDKKNWSLGHLLTMWGFMGLAVVGTATGIGTMVGILRTPLALISPLKILANTSALVILGGSLILLWERVHNPIKQTASTYFDWFFLLTLGGVALTGILSEIMRLAQFALLMYSIYYVHLVLIFALFLYAPYSKFAHLAYRTVALAAAEPWRVKSAAP
ncbi:Quinone-interacting membrane-bound oxidoreductase complex subunit C [Acidobacteriia bacterium SbA2]|nr:Quinone-interacting membrane-bound oxidoreductase complex subunit C [Acidobacteriia bacterium SbA2]